MTHLPLPAGLYYHPCKARPYGIAVHIPACREKGLERERETFCFSHFPTFEDALIAAMSCQEQRWLKRFGCKPPKQKQIQRKGNEADAGVHYYIDRKVRVDGRTHEIHYWTASWRKGGKSHLRKFGIKKYGYGEALERARAKRKDMTDDKRAQATTGSD